MKNLFEKSAKKARAIVRLDADKKAEMRNVLVRHMERNAVAVREANAGSGVPGYGFRNWKIPNLFAPFFKKPIPVLALSVALVMGIGTTYASEAALPGDVLYPVKIHVNENIRGLVAITPETRASWDVERARRRLDEAQKLDARGKLNEKVRADVESRFKIFDERAKQSIEKLKINRSRVDWNRKNEKEEDLVDASSRFESALRAHEKEFEIVEKKKVKEVEREEVEKEKKYDRPERVENETKHDGIKIEKEKNKEDRVERFENNGDTGKVRGKGNNSK